MGTAQVQIHNQAIPQETPHEVKPGPQEHHMVKPGGSRQDMETCILPRFRYPSSQGPGHTPQGETRAPRNTTWWSLEDVFWPVGQHWYPLKPAPQAYGDVLSSGCSSILPPLRLAQPYGYSRPAVPLLCVAAERLTLRGGIEEQP